MRTLITLLFTALLSQAVTDVATADGSAAGVQDRWLMLVGTISTDPTREADFNRWYDDIDIPDVLQVPGYKRARRGLRQGMPGASAADAQGDTARYVALYDIDTPNMDRTIIDMLMASRKMEMTGRSTSLLKVVERVYFHQHAPAYEVPKPRPAGRNKYLWLERVACCRDEATGNLLDDWYDNTHMQDMLATEGLVRATRYELYRVLMVEPKQVPHFLTVYELEADSAEQAVTNLRKVTDRLRASGRMSELFVEDGSALYLTIKDVSRQ